MPNHRRLYIPGSPVFLTWITYQRTPYPLHWPYSSFRKWVSDGYYGPDWGCRDETVGDTAVDGFL